MTNKELYIEPLIKLVEINEDKYWLETFYSLRIGRYLPGGGAGSLNDWGPRYSDKIKSSWYSNLYNILRHLFDNNLSAEQISSIKSVQSRNNLRIIRCLNCNKNYQHPSVFETHISLDFYYKNFVQFVKNKSLLNLFIPEQTFEKSETVKYRNWLTEQYAKKSIKIYDFIAGNYICPHCGKPHQATEHDLYTVNYESEGQKILQLEKQNAGWEDFEKHTNR